MTPSVSSNVIARRVVTSCLGLQEEEEEEVPQTAYP